LRSIAQHAHGGADAQPIPDPHRIRGVFHRTRMIAMPTIETRIAPDGATSYRAKVRRKGAAQVTASFARKTDAKKWAQDTDSAIRNDRYFKGAAAYRHTLAEAIDRYVREVLPRKSRTAPFQKRQLDWWRAELGHLFLADVTSGAISETRSKLMGQPGPDKRMRGPATANRYMAVLSHLLNVAIREWEWLEANAAQKLRKLKESRGRTRFLSEAECARLLTACQASSNPNLHTIVLLAISTGMRRNEILSLRFDQIDVEHGMIYLYDTKNGEARGVPLAGPALESMRQRLERKGDGDVLVFAGSTGVTPFDIRKPWYQALAAAKVQDVRFHDLRHTAASFLAKFGASLPTIGAVLGHKTAVMTKRYAHFADPHLRSVVAGMNARIFG
jgi:integrase